MTNNRDFNVPMVKLVPLLTTDMQAKWFKAFNLWKYVILRCHWTWKSKGNFYPQRVITSEERPHGSKDMTCNNVYRMKTSCLTLTFEHITWKSKGNIYFLGAVYVLSRGSYCSKFGNFQEYWAEKADSQVQFLCFGLVFILKKTLQNKVVIVLIQDGVGSIMWWICIQFP